jgi:DNA-binding transcriptional LysR family regulator
VKLPDLNDLQFFAGVVEHGGYAAAERALGIPKSRLSRRIAQLEAELGVRLLQRSTRKFAVTEVGQDVYRHAQSMMAEAQAAREAVDRVSVEPRGVVRISCPVTLAQRMVGPLLPEFMAAHPQVVVQFLVNNRRVDVISEGVDIALRVRTKLDEDGELVIRRFGQIDELLVASPAYLAARGQPAHPSELEQHATLSASQDDTRQRWTLHGPDGAIARIDIKPVLMSQDFTVLMAAAKAGQGITLLPETVCADAIRAGELKVVFRHWQLPQGICHAVYPSRRGVLPAVRALIDFLALRIPPLIEGNRLHCTEAGADG